MSAHALQLASTQAKAILAGCHDPGTAEPLRALIKSLDEAYARESLAEEGRGFNAEAAKHFLALARTGKRGTASGGEARCFRLASMLRKHLDDAVGIDASAQSGFIELFRTVPYGYDIVLKMLKGMDGRRV